MGQALSHWSCGPGGRRDESGTASEVPTPTAPTARALCSRSAPPRGAFPGTAERALVAETGPPPHPIAGVRIAKSVSWGTGVGN